MKKTSETPAEKRARETPQGALPEEARTFVCGKRAWLFFTNQRRTCLEEYEKGSITV
ncbi:hypothetical protein [Bacillus sp. FJAT-44742]|uniref:hypothetical protein n=1 Tax=Bacillus sp. FJAT-44742 TaxID=2014005 RepID=UPI0018E2516A|nr:hypothetical protein [Bacillus sp. FJAT-44742]